MSVSATSRGPSFNICICALISWVVVAVLAHRYWALNCAMISSVVALASFEGLLGLLLVSIAITL